MTHGGEHCPGSTGNCSFNEEAYELDFGALVSVPPVIPALGTRIRSIAPNPGRAAQIIRFQLGPRDDRASLEVFTVDGRRVWQQQVTRATSETQAVVWTGFDTRGSRCAPGVYWAVLRGRSSLQSLRFVRNF